MALSGTLKDFGIADILQLIGQQTKSGTLLLKSGDDEVNVLFVDGNVVFANEKSRNKADLLGSMLLRAELVTEEKLEEALTEQQRSLKRLGDVLLAQGAVTEPVLAQVMRLQTTETLYKLFRWKKGTYEFTQEEVDPSRGGGFPPIRAESILLEGFRRMDEWPAVRKKMPWPDAVLEKLKELDGAAPSGDGDEGAERENLRIVYRLGLEGRTVQKISDLSRLGEFETYKALNELCEQGYLKLVPPPRGPVARVRGLADEGRRLATAGAMLRIGLSLAFFLTTLLVLHALAPALGARRIESHARRGAAARLVARDQLLRLESALELYRVEHGEYPASLSSLVEAEMVAPQDLQYPFREPYHYRRTQQGFVLLPPLD
jgi:prepilin-type processing-associated H-X9-DG protein